MKLRLVRHATVLLEYAGHRFLLDPAFNDADSAPSPSGRPGGYAPLLSLTLSPEDLQEMIRTLSAIILTHTHEDHWDQRAIALLPQDLPVFCQPSDRDLLRSQGFESVIPVACEVHWNGIRITRQPVCHGGWLSRPRLGDVSGYFLESLEERSLMVTGDSVWCEPLAHFLDEHQPDVVLANAGNGRMRFGGNITMDIRDISRMIRHLPHARIAAVHMDAVSNCRLTRDALRQWHARNHPDARLFIPGDGEMLNF